MRPICSWLSTRQTTSWVVHVRIELRDESEHRRQVPALKRRTIDKREPRRERDPGAGLHLHVDLPSEEADQVGERRQPDQHDPQRTEKQHPCLEQV